MKSQLFGILAILSLLASCANMPSQDAWNALTGQDNRSWGYAQTQAAEQAKAIFSQPFNRKGRGRTYSRDQIQFDKILLPPNSLNTLKLRTYCMDKSDPAPKSNEKLYLVPVGKLIDRDIFPIYQSLMKYSHSHPEKHTQIQRIVWNFRSVYDDAKNGSAMHNEDYALLDTIYPNASQIVRSYFNKKNLTGKATEFLSNKLGEVLNQQGLGTNLLNQQNLMSTALHSISKSNSQVDSILRSLESMPVSGLIPNDNSDYSLLTNGVAVKATHRGGARNSELTIRNANDHPVVFQPSDYALESKRKTQRLGVGGVDEIQLTESSISSEQPIIYNDCDSERRPVYSINNRNYLSEALAREGLYSTGDWNLDYAEKVIGENVKYIKNAAKVYGVDPAIVAGAIYAENTLNVDWRDNIRDPIAAATVNGVAHTIQGKGVSLGIGQVRLGTALDLENKGYIEKSLDGRHRFYRLSFPDTSTMYSAAYIKYLSDIYPDVKNIPEIMSTLYNTGPKIDKNGNIMPIGRTDENGTKHYGYNCFGEVTKVRYKAIQLLLK